MAAYILKDVVKWRSDMKIIYRFRYLFLSVCVLGIISLEFKYLTGSETTNVSVEQQDPFYVYMNLVDVIFSDLQCFPVVKEEAEGYYPISYSDTWGASRSYGGERYHEGCDLMAVSNERGKYKVCSMTDGTVKNIGWLEQGGWRIGIESDEGIYYYYAHLDSYEKAFEKGERVVAGQILGRMGDSGYGKEPGTKGQFDVHLHVGIYVKDVNGKERAVNPYWYLKQLEI